MGKFKKIREQVSKDLKEEEDNEIDEQPPHNSEDDTSSSDSEVEGMSVEQIEDEKKRAVLWTNRERVLVLCARGADVRTRHLMNDIKTLLPHSKGDSKLDKQQSLVVINEIAEMKNCTKILFFESRKRKDTYLWMSNVNGGPSIKFLLHNIHTMLELKLSGNCLRASRPILSFDNSFDEKPHLTLTKHALTQVFGTPNHHPRSQPFVDHVISFSVTPDDKIWFRNFQIVDETLQLQEIGPRFVLETIRIFEGSFNGAVLYDNPEYISPNTTRREIKERAKAKSLSAMLHKKAIAVKTKKITDVLKKKTVDPVGEIFDTEREIVDDKAKLIADVIDKKRRKKVLTKGTAKRGKVEAN
ncbi:unnamed protein product [Auanema sp. JU1783]|nr:unnamed protein product [Auanema sp. JU1783]